MDLNKSMGSGAPAADRTIDVAIGIAGFDWLSANFVFELILPPDLVYQGIDRIPVCPETVSERTFLCLKYHSSVA